MQSIVLLTAALIAAGCGGAGTDTDGMNGACTELEGKTFQSTVQLECGLGPSGPVPCTWAIVFTPKNSDESSFSWHHSDVQETGTVRCVGGKLTGTPASLSGTYAGKWDEATGKLVWESVDYVAKP
jgi:hypothetical protein